MLTFRMHTNVGKQVPLLTFHPFRLLHNEVMVLPELKGREERERGKEGGKKRDRKGRGKEEGRREGKEVAEGAKGRQTGEHHVGSPVPR